MRVGLGTEGVVDRGKRQAESHEAGDGEDLPVIEPGIAECLAASDAVPSLPPHASEQYESPRAEAAAVTRIPRWRKVRPLGVKACDISSNSRLRVSGWCARSRDRDHM